MKKLLRIFLIEVLGIYFASLIAQGMIFEGPLGIIITGIALAIATFLLKPILNLLLLPLNLATMGVFKITSHVIVLYIVDLALKQFKIIHFHYPGLTSEYLDLPAISFENPIASYFSFALLIFIIISILNWILRK